MDLAGPIRGDDDGRRLVGLDGADLGNGDLEIRKQLEQEGLEFVVGAIDLVDQQHGRRRPVALDCLQ